MTSRRRQGGHGAPNEERFGVSQVIAADGIVYVAGQIGREADGAPVGDRRVEADWGKSVENLDAMLARVGARREEIVHAQVHTTLMPADATGLVVDAFGTVGTAGWCVRFPSFYAADYRFEISAFAVRGASDMHRQTVGPVDDFGFTQAVRAGSHVFVSGQRSQEPGGTLLHPGDLGAQYAVALERFLGHVRACGGEADDVVATWIYVVDLLDAGPELATIASAHRGAFGGGVNRPTASLIGVAGLATPGALVEVTGLAVVG